MARDCVAEPGPVKLPGWLRGLSYAFALLVALAGAARARDGDLRARSVAAEWPALDAPAWLVWAVGIGIVSGAGLALARSIARARRARPGPGGRR